MHELFKYKLEPIVRPGEYVALPCSVDGKPPTAYEEFQYYRVVTVQPIDNMVIQLAPRTLTPSLSRLNPQSSTYIIDPAELQLKNYELLQVWIKKVNFPLMLKFRVGGTNGPAIPSISSTLPQGLFFDWHTLIFQTEMFITGALIYGSERPKYVIEIYNPWSFHIPLQSGESPSIEVPNAVYMVLMGYRYIIKRVEKIPEKYTIIPVVPYEG